MEAITNLATETITNLATTARKSVFGESDPKAQSSTKPPAGTAPEKDTKESPHDSGNVPEQPVTALGKDTEGSPHDSSIVPEQPVTAPGKDSKESPHDLGNVPEQLVTAPGLQSPLTGPAVTGTAEAPHDSGNKPEQIQASGTADTTETLPSSSIPASKIDNPDPSKPSEMKSALAAHDAATTTNPSTASMAAKTGTESQPPKTSTATTPSHSALFGLGPDAEGGASSDAIHPPKRSAEFSGTIDEAGKSTGKQAEVKKNRLDGDDTGGYVGLKKAAMEEEAKRTNGDAASGSKLSEDEYRESSTFVSTTPLKSIPWLPPRRRPHHIGS